MQKRVVVTGGSGFIGSKLVEQLEKIGCRVDVFDIAGGKNICVPSQVNEAVRGAEAIFHLAAVADLNWARVYPIETMEINVQGTWNIADACRKYGTKLFYASTCCVYGNQKQHPVTEESLPNPAEIYACSKLAGEYVIKGFHHTYGLEYVMMRFATIYGEGTRPALATHVFLGQAMRGEPITVHGDGSQTRTQTHVNDLVDAIIASYRSGKMNETWNMTTTEEVSALQMAEDARRLTGSKSPIVFIPQRVGQTYRESISADHIKRGLGWEARVKWSDGFSSMYEWFKRTNQVNQVYRMPV